MGVIERGHEIGFEAGITARAERGEEEGKGKVSRVFSPLPCWFSPLPSSRR
jgi:hypothetical protein